MAIRPTCVRFWGLFLLWLMAVAVYAQGQAGLPPVAWRTLKAGIQSRQSSERTEAFQTEGQFLSYWKQQFGNESPPKGINWNQEFVVAIHLGQRSSGGFRVQVQTVQRMRGGGLEVVFTEVVPPAGSMVTQAITYPFVIAAIQRGGSNVSFRKATVTGGPTSSGSGVLWRTYASEVIGGRSALELVIRTPQEFEAYWRGRFDGSAPTDEIDWSREMLVAIHLGNQPSTGYDVLIDEVRISPQGVWVAYVKRVPAPGQRVRRSDTSPFTLIRIPNTSAPVRFSRRTWDGTG